MNIIFYGDNVSTFLFIIKKKLKKKFKIIEITAFEFKLYLVPDSLYSGNILLDLSTRRIDLKL